MGTQKIIWKANKNQRYSPLRQRNGHNLPVRWQSIVLIITTQMGPFIGGWSDGQPGLWWLTLYWIQMSSKVSLNVSINVKLGYKKIISYKDSHLFSKCTVNVTSFIKCDDHQWMYVMDNYSLISLRLGFWHVAALLRQIRWFYIFRTQTQKWGAWKVTSSAANRYRSVHCFFIWIK